jgi:hypothetical protein
MKYILTKREILKVSLIGIIVSVIFISVYVVLPSVMDLENEQQTYKGVPVYTCTEKFEITSCNNRTKVKGGEWSFNGYNLRDVHYQP